MHYYNRLVLFLFRLQLASTLTSLESSNLPPNATHASLSNFTPSPLLPTAILACAPPHAAPALPSWDCNLALEQLPSSRGQAHFHRGNRDVIHRLPQSASHAHCGIRIDLVYLVIVEQSSWFEIYDGAELLIRECVESRDGLGGSILVGDNLLIQVAVQYIDEAAGSSNKSTILSTRTPSSSPLSVSVPQCYPPGTGVAPDLYDCMVATSSMSANPMSDIFHKGGANDGYRLPVRYVHQTCGVFIDLVDDVQEEISNWLAVSFETELLILRCVQNGAHLGGDILVGIQDHIRVTAKYIIQAPGGNNNSATILNDLKRPIDP